METLKNRTVGQWLRGGPENDVVLSSRVRLARNIANYPFLSRAESEQISQVENLISEKFKKLELRPPLQYHRLDDVDPLALSLLVERHLIARDHADSDLVRGVAFSDDETLSIMVNEEDHLRIQAIFGGLRLLDALKSVLNIDDMLGEHLPFAFSADYGYLTACPTNVGTGMRASVMVHLPAIVMGRELDKLTRLCDQLDLALRGLYGEGTHGAADIYQISNNVTLGMTEKEIVDLVLKATYKVTAMERKTREELKNNHREELKKRIDKAFNLLCNAKSVSSEEALNLLSQVRMGVRLKLINGISDIRMDELLLLTLPAHLQTILGREGDRIKRNEMRASYIKQHLITSQKNNN